MLVRGFGRGLPSFRSARARRSHAAGSRLCVRSSGKGQPQNRFNKAFRKLVRQLSANASVLQGTTPLKRDSSAAARDRHWRRNLQTLRKLVNESAQDALWIGVLVLLAGRHGLDVRDGAMLDAHLLQVQHYFPTHVAALLTTTRCNERNQNPTLATKVKALSDIVRAAGGVAVRRWVGRGGMVDLLA